MTPDASATLELDAPLDLRRTLGTGYGPLDPTTRRDEHGDGVWRAMSTKGGPATLHVATHRAGSVDAAPKTRIEARAWGPGACAILERLPDLLGFCDEPARLVAHHLVVRDAQRRHSGLRLGRGHQLADVLIPTILGQRVTTSEAFDSWRAVVRAWGATAPGPADLMLPPTAEVLRRQPWYAFAAHDVDRKRSLALVEVCRLAHHFEKIEAMEPEAAQSFLEKIRGVGRWTAASAIAETHGWADAVPLGDYHQPNMVAWALAHEPRGDDALMLKLLAPYAGQRWRVIRLLEAEGIGAPRRGPKRAPWRTQVELASRRNRR